MATSTATQKKSVQTVHRIHFNLNPKAGKLDSTYKLIVRLESFNSPTEPVIYGFAGRWFQSAGKRTLKTWDEPQYFDPQNEIVYLGMLFKEKYMGCNIYSAMIVETNYPSRGAIVLQWDGKNFVTPAQLSQTSKPKALSPTLSERFQFRAWMPTKGANQVFHQTPIFDTSTGEYLEGLTLLALMQQIKQWCNINPNTALDKGQIYGGSKEYHITEKNIPRFGWFDSVHLIPLYHGKGCNSRPIESYARLFIAQN
jgi:hypothetical protein